MQVGVLEEKASVRKATLLDNAVLMRLKVGCFGQSLKLPTSQIEVDADKRRVRASKTILECAEAEAISKIDAKFKKWRDTVCMPSMIENGMHWVSIEKTEEVYDRFLTYRAERDVAVEALCAALPDRIEEDRAALRANFDPGDYPTADGLRKQYTVECYFVALTAPRSLQAVSEEMYATSKQLMERNVALATDAVREVLRAQFAELVNHLVDRLTPGPDGKKKVFRDTLTGNLETFFDSFKDRNLTDDAELARLVEEARRLVGGVDPDTLRSQDGLRNTVREGFEEVKAKLDGLITDAPLRMIEL